MNRGGDTDDDDEGKDGDDIDDVYLIKVFNALTINRCREM